MAEVGLGLLLGMAAAIAPAVNADVIALVPLMTAHGTLVVIFSDLQFVVFNCRTSKFMNPFSITSIPKWMTSLISVRRQSGLDIQLMERSLLRCCGVQ